MSDILEKILATKREEVAALKAKSTPSKLLARCAELPPTRGFRVALLPSLPPPNPLPLLRGGGEERAGGGKSPVALIAEVKKASPSKGVIRPDFDPVAIARAYFAGGASCLSVLTDETYFQGRLGYLAAIREAVPLPLLRKDFLIDPIQVYEARLAGADAILLIVAAIPSPARLAEMRHAAESLGMDALVEVHDEAELALAVESGATLIGVNNRDLKTFTVQLETFERLAPLFAKNTVAVAESGIATAADVVRMGAAGAHAVLVGESLMRQTDVEAATRSLLVS
ncbi:indole-3-glycerol phosphate synthase TrpC [Armatimonas sp.]|uniref:indole-3-glycerol phosphate synthase TrpC n=1 Tax=Armatimonas sp. TaxID=1872638 RepID=UPI00374DEED1